MNKKTVKTLEFDKIAQKLASYAVMDVTKSAAKNISFETNIDKVNIMLSETAKGCELITKKGNPPIFCADDIRSAIKRCELSGTLSPRELIGVAKLLKTARMFKTYPDDIDAGPLSEHIEALFVNKALETKIFSVIIDDETIADDASPELSDIRRKLKGTNKKIKDILQDMIS